MEVSGVRLFSILPTRSAADLFERLTAIVETTTATSKIINLSAVHRNSSITVVVPPCEEDLLLHTVLLVEGHEPVEEAGAPALLHGVEGEQLESGAGLEQGLEDSG